MIKLIVSFFLILFCFSVFSQEDTLIDFPIKQIDNSRYYTWVDLREDSINEVSIRANIFTVDRSNLSVPVEYTVYMTQYFPTKYHLFVVSLCADSSHHRMSYRVPDHCQYWAEPDSNTVYFPPNTIGKLENSKSVKSEPYRPDSVNYTDMECVLEFYSVENDSIRADTLFEQHGTRFDLSRSNGIPYWQCSYYLELKHGKEIAHYHLNEVSGKCLNGDTNLKKYEGEWDYGWKKGKWYFYSIYGDLVRIEIYRKGICKKIKIP